MPLCPRCGEKAEKQAAAPLYLRVGRRVVELRNLEAYSCKGCPTLLADRDEVLRLATVALATAAAAGVCSYDARGASACTSCAEPAGWMVAPRGMLLMTEEHAVIMVPATTGKARPEHIPTFADTDPP